MATFADYAARFLQACPSCVIVHMMQNADVHGDVEAVSFERHMARIHRHETCISKAFGGGGHIGWRNVNASVAVPFHVNYRAPTGACRTSDIQDIQRGLRKKGREFVGDIFIVVADLLLKFEDE